MDADRETTMRERHAVEPETGRRRHPVQGPRTRFRRCAGRGGVTPPPPAALRPLRAAVLVTVATGVVIALITLLRFDHVLAAAQAADPSASRDTLVTKLWSQIGVAGGVAVLWPLLLRRLSRGNSRGYARIQRVPILVAVLLVAAAVTGAGPLWLHAARGVQAVTMLGVFAATLHPGLRAWHARHRPVPGNPGWWRPVLLLVVLTPLIAELSWGSLQIQVAYALPILVSVYGAGALLVRELVRRAGRGWASILLLGVAYEIIEDGFGLQALFSPHIYHAAQWGARVFGINFAYADLKIIYHAVFTIAVPILVTELVVPDRRHQPYLRLRGLILTAVCYLLGIALIRFAIAPHAPGADPSYTTPISHLFGAALLVTVLGITALAILPRTPRHQPGPDAARRRSTPPPHPGVLATLGGVGTIIALRLPTPLGTGADSRPMLGPGLAVVAQIAASLATVAAILLLLRHWSTGPGWNDQHRAGLAAGLLLAHTLVGASIFAPGNHPELAALAALTIIQAVLTLRLYRKTRARTATPAPQLVPTLVVNSSRSQPPHENPGQHDP